MMSEYRKFSWLVFLGCLLTSCSLPQQKQQTVEEHDPNKERLEQAQVLEKNGRYSEAAENYWAYAELQTTPAREKWQIHAASQLQRPGNEDQARYYLDRIDEARLSPAMLVDKRLLDARLDEQEQNYSAVLQHLPTTLLNIASSRDTEILKLRARALLEIQQLLASVKTRIALASRLDTSRAVNDNIQAIWQTLQQATNEQLLGWLRIENEATLQGWLELAHIGKNPPVALDELKQQLALWQRNYPAHPAREDIPQTVIAGWQSLQLRPNSVALLLPITGKLASLGQAIHAGILAAQLEDDSPTTPSLKVHDTGDELIPIQSIYTRAVFEGADLVIGPLQKNHLEDLAASGDLPVPVMALNTLEANQTPPKNLFQFGLLPEDEARQVAERASLDGHESAIVFVPESDWGARLAYAFNNRFEELGGITLTTEFYPAEKPDYSVQIKRALNIDSSEQRFQQLQRVLQRKLLFEPSPRQDADMIFIAASPRQARLLKPQLKFHYASHIPVYATSHIYSGIENPGENKDINGITFCDMPWILTPELSDPELYQQLEFRFPDSLQQLPRFTALGTDAYRVIPYLKRLASQHYERYSGVTGNLFSDSKRRIHRELKWAMFRNGRAVLLGQPEGIANTVLTEP